MSELRQVFLLALRDRFRSVQVVSEAPSIWLVNGYPTNVRTATEKSGSKFWFDVTPELYERRQVEFFVYVCGQVDTFYVFPRLTVEALARDASLGGQKQVPNFTLLVDSDEFEPAGKADNRQDISGFRRALFLIPST